MNTRGYQHYKEQSLSTMTQNELLLLLYDELVKRLIHCDLALDKQDWKLLDASADRCIEIFRYLDDTLDRKYPVSGDLHRLYDYFIYEMHRIKLGRNKGELDQIKPMVMDLRDTFKTADKNCGAERRSGNGAV